MQSDSRCQVSVMCHPGRRPGLCVELQSYKGEIRYLDFSPGNLTQ